MDVTREDLYERVWSKPMIQIARELGISPPSIVLACKEMGIPRPPQGYWLKDEARRALHRKPALPALHAGKRDRMYFSGQSGRSARPPGLTVAKPAGPIRDELQLVTTTREALSQTQPDSFGMVWPSGKILSIRTSRKHAERALGIMNRVLHYIEANGWTVVFVQRPQTATYHSDPRVWRFEYATTVRVGDVGIEVYIDEGSNRQGTPNGTLSFKICGLTGTGVKQIWTETGNARLEAKVDLITLGLAAAAHAHVAREEEQRRRAEELERRERECREAQERAAEARRKKQHLMAMVERHDIAERIRRLVGAAREASPSEEQLREWMDWANEVARCLDPVTAPGDLATRLVAPNEAEWLPPGWPAPGAPRCDPGW